MSGAAATGAAVTGAAVLRLSGIDRVDVAMLLSRYGMDLRLAAPEQAIPGSYWGDAEAGLERNILHARLDTPLHSVLHEACHYICMSPERRVGLLRDAGGDDLEESAVCYLQILLADHIRAAGRERLMRDMDAWGYSFRLGATRTWFESDAGDARAWLKSEGLIDDREVVTWKLRC